MAFVKSDGRSKLHAAGRLLMATFALVGGQTVAVDAATQRGKRTVSAKSAITKPQLAALTPLSPRAAQTTLTQPAQATTPLVAVVSLSSQSMTVYSGTDVLAKSPISSGMDGYRTPTGVFSILQKARYHESNIYDGAPMPFMQRLTWSGIALHAGRLPGYRASHGCIRLPDAFAERLFGMTKMGARVIVTTESAIPSPVTHARLPTPIWTRVLMTADARPSFGAGFTQVSAGGTANDAVQDDATSERWFNPVQVAELEKRRTAAALAEAQSALRQHFSVAAAVAINADEAQRDLAAAEQAHATYRGLLARAHDSLSSAVDDEERAQAQASVFAAAEAIEDADAAILAARTQDARARTESFVVARRARDAEDAADRAETAARLASRGNEPITVFVSRKENKVLVRQSFQTLFEGDVTISDPARPLGTHVLTAGLPVDDGRGLLWSAVSIADGGISGGSAQAALDRITLDERIAPEIGRRLWTGATLIISDQGLSTETGKGTDFVVLTK
jgi:lipoprotein-anchoring transpeptidase ErfK/SrfK